MSYKHNYNLSDVHIQCLFPVYSLRFISAVSPSTETEVSMTKNKHNSFGWYDSQFPDAWNNVRKIENHQNDQYTIW